MSKYFIDLQNKTTNIFKTSFLLERIVLLYLELQFPLSAISLRFAARIPPQSGLREFSFLAFNFLDF